MNTYIHNTYIYIYICEFEKFRSFHGNIHDQGPPLGFQEKSPTPLHFAWQPEPGLAEEAKLGEKQKWIVSGRH